MIQKTLPRIRWRLLLTPWEQMDWSLLALVVGLTVFGGLMIYTTEVHQGIQYSLQHLVLAAAGVAIALGIARWPYDLLLQWHWGIYALTNLTLVVVMLIGVTANGAQSWLQIGDFNVQPSEFAKLALIVTLAALLHHSPASRLTAVVRVLAVTALPWVLVFIQPDLGTSLVFGAITLGMLYWGNANPGWLVLLVSPLVSMFLFSLYFPGWLLWAICTVAIAWLTLPWRIVSAVLVLGANIAAGRIGIVVWNLLKDYQKDRLTLFLDPEQDPLGGGYHLIQSRIAIGSGGLWGRGLFHGSQTQLNFIPEQHTDFIYSAVGEELGFIGSIAVIIVFWAICVRLMAIACSAKDDFGSLLAAGMLSMVAFQVVINIGMTVGLAPITGIPLPWMSYGRSALLTNFIALGLVESVANYRPKKQRY
ncbi:MAG: rod shape-determining protein RodA [Chloroflexaceae bacterium]|nr:rod shape-determining protein RodA [Chloroflexaceae bacterium]